MKKIILLLLAATFSLCARSQVRSIGVSVGSYEAVSFQHVVYGTDNVFQLEFGYHMGLPNDGSLRLMGAYNIMIASPKWTEKGTWNFYAGPGVYLGGGWAPGKGLTFGVMANVGLEYLFGSVPLQLSADIRPAVGTVMTKDKFIYDNDSLLGLAPTVSVRYMF